MDYKKAAIISLSAIASLTLAGVGFASWVFNIDTINTPTNEVALHVVSDVEKGELSIVESPTLAIFSSGYKGKDDLSDGINFYSKDGTYNVENDKIILRYKIIDENDSIEGNDFRLFISISDDAFASYVTPTSLFSDASTSDGYDFSSDLESASISSTDYPLGYYQYTLNLNKAIQYVSGDVKPLNNSTYSSFSDALNNASITIKFVVK